MAHEITDTDGLVLTKNPAWHKLGLIVPDAPNAKEALKLAGFDWEVQQWIISATNGDKRLAIDSHLANVRMDTGTLLGIVGNGYTPFQNSDTADFIEALVEGNDKIKIESAGSIRGGKKVWFLLQAESFSVLKYDMVQPYILVSNGFDGDTGFRCTPTTVRVVCSNTLHMVIPGSERSKFAYRPQSYVVKHTRNLMERVEEAKAALGLYNKSVDNHRELIDTLTLKDVNSDLVKKFWLECYVRQFGEVDMNPKDTKGVRAKEKALEAMAACQKRFDIEGSKFGSNAWIMLNAYTGWVQNDRTSKGRDHSNLLGTNSDRTSEAFSYALSV